MGLIIRVLFSFLLLLAYPNFAHAAVAGCYLMEDNASYYLMENATDRYVLEGGTPCGAVAAETNPGWFGQVGWF